MIISGAMRNFPTTDRVDSAACRRTQAKSRPRRPTPSSSGSSCSCTSAATWSPKLEAARTDPESMSAQAERLLYFALVGALEAGLVRTAEDALTVLRQASQPLGPMGAEWLKRQEREL